MNKEKCNPEKIWKQYQQGVNYNNSIHLYDTVKRNENFYLGRQWEGLKAPDLEKPVFNFIDRVVTYFIAMLVSDDIGVDIKSFKQDSVSEIADKALSTEVLRVIERTKAKAVNREAVRDAAVDGDCFAYFRFDADVETGQLARGEIAMELINNTDVIFGNPYDEDVQEQPYIIIAQRKQTKVLQREAKAAGVKEWEQIVPDNSSLDYMPHGVSASDLTTVLIKLYKDSKSGTVHYTKSTQTIVLQEDTDLDYRLYPIARMGWKRVKNSYHAQAAITDGVVQNQIYVNKMWALFMIQTVRGTFPTTFYDKSKIKSWDNRAGAAIGVQGAPDASVVMDYKPADFSQQAVDIVQRTIDYTKEFMGATDVALGNIKPENTSAIIATQKASAAPLELQRLAFYQFVEDYVRVIIDIIRSDYGLREVAFNEPISVDEMGNALRSSIIDFSALNTDAMELNIEVGSASYWSELTQIQTADNLFSRGIITDAQLYLDSIPDKYIRNKQKIIDNIEQMQQMQAMQAQAMPQGAGNPLGAQVAQMTPQIL